MYSFNKFQELCNKIGKSPSKVISEVGLSKSLVSTWRRGAEPFYTTISKLANYFHVDVDYFTDDEVEAENPMYTFDVLASVKAGYDGMAYDTTGDKAYFTKRACNHNPEEYFVLRISGMSMYPMLLDGDYVLCKKAESVESGKIAVITVEDEESTVKRVKYVKGQNWLTLEPINPEYAPRTIEGENLEHCHVFGEVVALQRNIV